MISGLRYWMILALIPGLVCLAGCPGGSQNGDDDSSGSDDDGGGSTVTVDETPAPSNPILIILPGADGGWSVEDDGTLRAATFGDDKEHARFFGDHQLWGKYDGKWYRIGALKIELDDGDSTVIKAFDSNGLVAWKEGGTVPPICGYDCAYDFPDKWDDGNVKTDGLKGSGQDLGAEQQLTQVALEPTD